MKSNKTFPFITHVFSVSLKMKQQKKDSNENKCYYFETLEESGNYTLN